MERSKIRLILFLILVSTFKIYSQGLFVDYNHPIYPFLERMEVLGLIENYTNEIKPLPRSKVTEYLSKIFDKRFSLDKVDRDFLNYFIDEFYFDLTGKLDRYDILLTSNQYSILSAREKFVYAYNDKNEFSLFVKSYFNISSVNYNKQRPAELFDGGGRIYGNFKNILGFELDGKNGIVFGSKSTALQLHELSYNFKLNEKPESRFFDRSYGYISLELPNISLSIGKNRQIIGYGINRLILSDYSPNFEKITFHFNYKSFNFNFTHGWLQNSKTNTDSLQLQRYFVHHRIAFSPSKNFRIGIGEAVIYRRTSPELSYLNPFNFYKSVEHQLQDRDNSLMYFDFELLPIKNFQIYSTFVIDDIDFGKIGKHWYGNKTAINLGTKFYQTIREFPFALQFEYTRIEPYTFTHRFKDNAYINFDLPLTTEQQPNSYRFDFAINLLFSPQFQVGMNYSLTKWGKNYFENGKFVNVGGDILFGKQNQDSDLVYFLDGKIETIHSLNLTMTYEFIRNIKINSELHFKKFSSGSSSLILLIGLISFL